VYLQPVVVVAVAGVGDGGDEDHVGDGDPFRC
jgi:hypothetical protein